MSMSECSICFENIIKENTYFTECCHVFCIDCFNKWKESCERLVTCPNCRTVLETKMIVVSEPEYVNPIDPQFALLYTHVPPAVPYVETERHFNLLISNLPSYFDGRQYEEEGDDEDENSVTDFEVDEDYFEDEEDEYLNSNNLTKKYREIDYNYNQEQDRRDYYEFVDWYNNH